METEAVKMENTVPEVSPTTTEKLARAPGEVGTAMVDGTETLLRDGAKVIVRAGTVIVEATKVVVSHIVDAGEQLGRDVKEGVSPAPSPPKSPAIPGAIAPPA
jgi:hypothetical protein